MPGDIKQDEYDGFRLFLEQSAGITLGDNKQYLVNSRLNRLMSEKGITSLGDLVDKLKQGAVPGLRETIIDAMTTNETLWFRDNSPFKVMQEEILPTLGSSLTRNMRIWSAACSSGQEPYSLSMLVEEFKQASPGKLKNEVEIVATDISPTVLKAAKEARYDGLSMARGMSDERKQKFFTEVEKQWEVKPEIRKRVTFKELNLLDSYSGLGKFDIIFCRNVLIYFSSDLKRDIISRMSKSLNPGGLLILGSSESLTGHSDQFELVRSPICVHYKLK
ncbi:MAG: protein-glutamate O-methyltransferase CheR [Gammaproteobacteria bacterium]|nr:protein-glutamate O-methyltransferase CheR [Gammaproteobacteria bacterium]